jgi:hypothetical protein
MQDYIYNQQILIIYLQNYRKMKQFLNYLLKENLKEIMLNYNINLVKLIENNSILKYKKLMMKLFKH